MSRDRQIAVLASIVGLAGLIVGIVAISQVSGAEDDWVRNRALPGAASSEGAVLQKQFAVQEVADLTERVAEIERLDTLTERASTEADEKSDTTNVAVQGVTNEVADLAERVAEFLGRHDFKHRALARRSSLAQRVADLVRVVDGDAVGAEGAGDLGPARVR